MFFYRHINEIREICREAKVSVLYVTGDVLHDRDALPEVLELVVTFKPEVEEMYYHYFYLLQSSMEDLLQTRVELIDYDRLKNQAIRKRILEHAEVLYNLSIAG
jgi:predicted nucleotidyltransferase